MGSSASTATTSSTSRCRTGRRGASLRKSPVPSGDGHYQLQFLPAFAAVMVPFTLLPKQPAEVVWFALTIVMTWGFVRLSIAALPDRRVSVRVLFWLTLLFNGKFLYEELALRDSSICRWRSSSWGR